MNALEDLLSAGGTLEQFFTPAYVAQAKAYVEPLRIRSYVDLAIGLGQYAVVFAFALHVKLYDACARWAGGIAARMPPGSIAERYRKIFERVWHGPGMGASLVFVLAMESCLTVLGLPEVFYFDYWREHREGMSHQPLGGWLYDFAKGQLLYTSMVAFAMLGVYLMIRRLPRWTLWILAAGGAALLLGSALIDPYRARLTYDHKPLADGPIRTAVVATLEKGHVEFQNVVVENMSRSTERADAYFAGEGPTRHIVLGDTLLHRYEPDEIAAIVAHEMGHLSESRWLPRFASAATFFLAVLAMGALLRVSARRGWFGLRATTDITGYMLMYFAFQLATQLSGPVANWRSRIRESEADSYALNLTHDPQSFVVMMSKLAAQNRSDPIPPGWLEAWRAGHPAPARRIAMGLHYAHEHAIPLALPPPQDARPVASTP